MKTAITVAHGDGIGPEIMEATLKILEKSGAPLKFDHIDIGEKLYLKGFESGIEPQSWNTIRNNKIFLKAPITTPQGGGYKSLNVTIRKSLGLFANVRPVKTYYPFVSSNFKNIDLCIIRENEEDLYAGIEHQQTNEVIQTLKLVSKPGTERIIRYAFEYARVNNRKHITCMSKDNIMKLSDGMFHKMFNQIALEYPEIDTNHMIIDIGSAKLADNPEMFDVIVTLNLYGDIISDIAAEVAGSVGLGGSANAGMECAMFEAIHGSAPDIAGKNLANPSGLINGAIMMLCHMGMLEYAEKIQNAWSSTLEQGIHTGDIFSETFTKQKVGTQEFAQAVIENLGNKPNKLKAVEFNKDQKPIQVKNKPLTIAKKELIGVDVFLDWNTGNRNPEELGKLLESIESEQIKLKMITNRGVKVYPAGLPETYCTDHWRCRFISKNTNSTTSISNSAIVELLNKFSAKGLDFIKTENLYTFDGERGYSLGQGE